MGSDNTTKAVAALMVLAGLGASACGGDDETATSEPAPAADTQTAQSAETAPSARPERTDGGQGSSGGGDAGAEGVAGMPSLPVVGPALAISAGVTVETADIRRAVDDTLLAVRRHGASVDTADVNIGSEREDGTVDGVGYFVVRVPPADLELLIDDLGATVGQVSGRTQDSADVADQLVELDIRIAVERDVIDRFRSLLDDADEFQDVVEIERVISERTIALERLLAGQRNLEDRVEFATLTIELRFAAPIEVIADPSNDGIADAWRSGWDVFVGVLFVAGFGLAVAAPFLVMAALVMGVVWLIVRRRRSDAARQLDVTPDGATVLAAPSPKE